VAFDFLFFITYTKDLKSGVVEVLPSYFSIDGFFFFAFSLLGSKNRKNIKTAKITINPIIDLMINSASIATTFFIDYITLNKAYQVKVINLKNKLNG
jgi:hypothetical protein